MSKERYYISSNKSNEKMRYSYGTAGIFLEAVRNFIMNHRTTSKNRLGQFTVLG